MKKELDDYVAAFKNLDLETKREEIIRHIKEVVGVFDKVGKDFNNNIEFIANAELLDIKKSTCTEEDFLEGLFVYILNLEEIMESLPH
jgi:hypothetical protein